MARRAAAVAIVLFIVAGCDSSGGDCVVPDFPKACCCQGDVVDSPTCGSDGLSCSPGYRLYGGDDCQCLAHRNTPCCLPHAPRDSGMPVMDSATTDGDSALDASDTARDSSGE